MAHIWEQAFMVIVFLVSNLFAYAILPGNLWLFVLAVTILPLIKVFL